MFEAYYVCAEYDEAVYWSDKAINAESLAYFSTSAHNTRRDGLRKRVKTCIKVEICWFKKRG